MTRTLILMRHAKSSWDDPALDDHERPLNKRGIRSASALGHWMKARGWHPDQALVSTATRTRQTFAGLDLDIDGDFTDALYHANAVEMQMVLETARGKTVLMIGHNPAISEFAAEMAASPHRHPRFGDFPTGATVVMRFDIDSWDKVEPETGQIVDFIIPRELPDT